MREKIGRVIRCVLFVGLFAACVMRVYHVLAWKDTTGGYLSSVSQLYHTDEGLMDVVFLGSSHCYCGVYPCYLWRDQGISAFDMAVSGQDKASTYHALVETLKTQSPRIVCVDMYGLLFEEHQVPGNVYRNMLSLKTSSNSVALVRDYVEQEEQKDFLLRWPIIHTRYRELGKYDFRQYQPSVYGRGADFGWNVGYAQVDPDVVSGSEIGVLSEENGDWLAGLYALSEEHDFDLIFFMAPCPVDSEQQGIINAAAAYADSVGVSFFDFNKLRDEVGFDYGTDFVDAYHLNAWGSEKLTGYLGAYFADHYTLADHRGDERYAYWDLDLKNYYHQKAIHDLKEITDAKEYLAKLKGMEEIVSVVSLEAGFSDAGDYYYELALEAGIGEEEYASGGKWIWQDGQMEKVMDNTSWEEYLLDLSDTDTLRIRNFGELSTQNIMINAEGYSNRYGCLSIVTYDLFLEEVIEQREF